MEKFYVQQAAASLVVGQIRGFLWLVPQSIIQFLHSQNSLTNKAINMWGIKKRERESLRTWGNIKILLPYHKHDESVYKKITAYGSGLIYTIINDAN